MTDSPSWYDAQMDDDAMLGPDFAERRSEGPRYLHPSPRYDVCALMDALITAKLIRDGDLPESERKEAA